MNLKLKITLCITVGLSLAGIPPITVVQGRPDYAVSSGNNCSACHTSTVSGRMEISGTDLLTDLAIQLDGQAQGPLKTFRVSPGQILTVPIRVLNGSDKFAIQIKGFEKKALRHDTFHGLIWSPANSDDNHWTKQQKNNPPYFTKDNGANGGLTGSPESSTYFFDLLIEPNTPLDIYELVAAVPGKRNGVKVYQEERFYLEVLSPYDLDGDSKIDCSDICALVDQWHKDYARYDFSPMPDGDGIVDAQDLVILSDHLFEDHRLLAHWTLDDVDGPVTIDSIGNLIGMVPGIATWQPNSGQVDGALSLTGFGNYLRLPFISNLAIRPFSVFIWVKGGASGQVILSQDNEKNWLMASPESGTLMTELTAPGPDQEALVSDTLIVDGAWHHVGLVWNGTHRMLYVDNVEVAKDEIPQPAIASQALSVGAGVSLAPSSFWTGLVDDIRIYDRPIEVGKPLADCDN